MRISRQLKWALGAVALLLVVVLLLPVLIPFGWRLWRGNTVEFQSWSVRVPAGWLVQESAPSLVVTKLPWGYPLVFSNSSYVVLVHLEAAASFDLDNSYPAWKQQTLRGLQGQGYRLGQEHALRVADRDCRCLEFAAQRDDRWVQVVCFHARDVVSASFQGDSRHVGQFYGLLAAVTRMESSPAPSMRPMTSD